MKTLLEADLNNKKVGIRVDLNVPIKEGKILSHEKLSAALPSILHILERTQNLCIISHLGRPTEGDFDPNYSLLPIKEWFDEKLKKELAFTDNLDLIPEGISLLENIRFFNGEKENNEELSQKIADAFDVYVMDAFATAHRRSASTFGAIKKSEVACAGMLFSKEVINIEYALKESGSLNSIVGGSKISTKLKVIESLLKKSQKVLVGGGIANTFLKASGYEIGKSLAEDNMLNMANNMLETGKIILPEKVYVSESMESKNISLVPISDVSKDKMILDIEFNNKEIKNYSSKATIWNGPLGIFEIDEFSNGTKSLINYLEQLDSKVIAGGGETIFAINKFSDIKNFHYVSTAGGAFLEYLGGSLLPSIEALKSKSS